MNDCGCVVELMSCDPSDRILFFAGTQMVPTDKDGLSKPVNLFDAFKTPNSRPWVSARRLSRSKVAFARSCDSSLRDLVRSGMGYILRAIFLVRREDNGQKYSATSLRGLLVGFE